MNTRIGTQLSAFGLAALATLSLMGGIQHLATGPVAADTMAASSVAPTAQVAQAARPQAAGG